MFCPSLKSIVVIIVEVKNVLSRHGGCGKSEEIRRTVAQLGASMLGRLIVVVFGFPVVEVGALWVSQENLTEDYTSNLCSFGVDVQQQKAEMNDNNDQL